MEIVTKKVKNKTVYQAKLVFTYDELHHYLPLEAHCFAKDQADMLANNPPSKMELEFSISQRGNLIAETIDKSSEIGTYYWFDTSIRRWREGSE